MFFCFGSLTHTKPYPRKFSSFPSRKREKYFLVFSLHSQNLPKRKREFRVLAHLDLAYRFRVCESIEGSRLLAVPSHHTNWWRLGEEIRHTPNHLPREFGIQGIPFNLLLFYLINWFICLILWMFSMWNFDYILLPNVIGCIENPTVVSERLACLN